MSKRFLITGIDGFIGSHLADWLVSRQKAVVGMVQPGTKTINIDHLLSIITIFRSDLLDAKKVREGIKKYKPDVLINLAGQSSNLLSFSEPEFTFRINVDGVLNILETVRLESPGTKVILIGSSEEYGMVKKADLPIQEAQTLNPINPYAVSKEMAEILGLTYFKYFNLQVVLVRLFNQEGPRRQEGFALSNFTKQIVEIEKGLRPKELQVGNIGVKRDFSDVRDTVRALYLLSSKGKPGEIYNLCSGVPRKMKNVLDILISLSKVKGIKITVDPKRVRPSENPVFYGDNRKIKMDTGWEPKIDFTQTLQEMLEHWRSF